MSVLEVDVPTYVYTCESCGIRIEKLHGINESPSFNCPSCSGRLTREISGGSGFLFKGQGFYTTDYRSEAYKQAEKKEKDVEKSAGDTRESGGKKGE
jgi:putative FmdB family regulatory protein